MKQILTAFLISIIISSGALAQSVRLSGIVKDSHSGQPLSDVHITVKETGITGETDQNGTFRFINLKPGTYHLRFEKIGYKPAAAEFSMDVTDIAATVTLAQTLLTTGEVVITSAKYDQLVKETPIPIELVDKEQIVKSSSVGVSDILRNQPGIAMARDGIWGTDVNIRGLSRQNVVTLVDGNRVETASNHAASLSLVDIMDVDNVEVIKGGISSLYGTGATGGVVSITTRRPSYTDMIMVKGSLTGGYNTVNKSSAGNVSVSASSTNWFAKLAGTARNAENTKTPDGYLLNSQFHDNNISASAGYKLFENHQILVDYQKFKGSDIGIPGGKTFPATASAKYTEASREMYSFEYKLANLLSILPNASLKYFDQKITRAVELKVNPNPTTAQTVRPAADHKTWGVQLLTNWVWNQDYHIAAGVDLWQRSYSGFRTTTVKTPTKTIITGDFPVPDSKYRSLGFYIQENMLFFEKRLKINWGGRYDFIHVTNDIANNPYYTDTNGVRYNNPPKNVKTSYASSKVDNKSWSANIGAMYSVAEGIDVTINAARAFRSPVLEERFQYINLGGAVYLGNPNLNPEVGTFLDAGLRFWQPDFNCRLNIFRNTFKDLVVDNLIGANLYQKANIGEARIYGFDFGGEVNFYNGFVAYGSAGYARGEDTKKSQNLPQIPPFNARAGLKHNILGYAELDLNAMFFSSQDKTASGELRTPGYSVYNAYLSSMEYSLLDAHFKLFAGVENIFDRQYRDHLSTDRAVIKSEPGRNLFIKLTINW